MMKFQETLKQGKRKRDVINKLKECQLQFPLLLQL